MKRVALGICTFLFFSNQLLIGQEKIGSSSNKTNRSGISEPRQRCANLSLWGDFLYWKATVSNLPYAVLAELDTINGFQFANRESVKNIHFHYDPGFRVGIAGQFDTGWDLLAQYTRFYTSAHVAKKATSPDLIFPLWDLALPAMIDQLKARQSLKFDQINLDFVKHFSLGTHFSLDPFFGATGALIHQQMNITAHQVFDPPSTGTVTIKIKNFFEGGGLGVGLQTNFVPTRWFSLYGRGAYSLLYGKFKLSTRSVDSVIIPPLLTLVHKQPMHEFSLISAFDIAAGIKTTWSFSCCQLAAHLDYEFVYWPGQVRVPRIRSDVSTKTPTTFLNDAKGDVGFHGLTTGLMFSF